MLNLLPKLVLVPIMIYVIILPKVRLYLGTPVYMTLKFDSTSIVSHRISRFPGDISSRTD
jgi:hypothetical protein